MGRRGRGTKRKSSHGVTLVAQGKGIIKRTQLSPFYAAGSDDVEYVVRAIKVERLSGGTPQWLIGWESLSDKEDTWEPIEHLAGHEQDIAAFRERRKSEATAEEAEASAKKNIGKKTKIRMLKKNEDGKIAHVKCLLCPPENKPIPFCGNTTNLRSHLASMHKDVYCAIVSSDENGNAVILDNGAQSSASQGKIEALVPLVTPEKRDELHKLISLWLVRCRRPLSLPEHDAEFRDIFYFIFKGNYVPPTLKIVMHNVLLLSVEGKQRVMAAIRDLLAEGISPSIGGDVWSQSGASIFGILLHWLDEDFNLHEKVLGAIPFSSVRHNADQLEKATKKACTDVGLGQYELTGEEDARIVVDTVADYIRATCSDNASNMLAAWKCFDGHECIDHTLALVVKTFLEHPVVKSVFSKLRGMTTHFNHSVIGGNLLKECQRRHGLGESKPPQDNDTRTGWGGACKQARWYFENQVAIQMYDVENPSKAATTVANPDGSVYRAHQLAADDWNIVREAMYLLTYAKTAVDLLQHTKKVTVNLILPVVGHRPIYTFHADTLIKYERQPVFICNEAVKEARELAYKDLVRRFFNGLYDSKLEDFAVSTLLDPRYKSFKFKYAENWMRGHFLRKQAEAWATACYAADWKARAGGAAVDLKSKRDPRPIVVSEASFLEDSDSDDEVEGDDELTEGELARDEMRDYLELPAAKSDVDVQRWWRDHRGQFPTLAKMARQFLVVPASTAGVERAFSMVTGMHSDLRKRLEEGTLQHTLMAATN
ncbi:hypothetical protein CYMTET_45618 [Cymbomonas tetramitiformis]|uniref:Chromo domain-containing protein n=1 Tax=Cymbomonas tetramitiformis TaxID=36881 RepID=A0AAE0BXV8_9CHLO|nr:hypothetical protein CYMTET_45618 [Cymbomonas tetramitiformis]